MQKTILVTGGAGFIGSHLCEKLIDMGERVICVDNLFTGSIRNIDGLIGNEKFRFIEHDVTKEIFIDEHIDQIYNLACPASPVHYQRDPIKTIKTSFLGALHSLGIAKKDGARILQASTSEVYGNPLVHPQDEKYWGNVNPIGVRSCYDEGKRATETLFFDYHREHGVDIRIIRIFNTYGPRMSINDGRVVSNFIVQAINNESITIYGDGSQTRSFCYVDDMVQRMITIMNYEQRGFCGPVNIGTQQEIMIKELAYMIIKLTKSKSDIIFCDLPQDDPERRRPNLDYLKTIMNVDDEISIDAGLVKTIDYFKSILLNGDK